MSIHIEERKKRGTYCGHHLGNVWLKCVLETLSKEDNTRRTENERTLGVTVPDTNSGLVVHRSLVKSLDTVPLSGGGRREVDDYHLQERIAGGKELAHDDLEQSLALEVTLLLQEFDVELFEHGEDGVLLEVHDGIEDFEDGVEDKHGEGTLEGLAIVSTDVGPLAGSGVEVVVTPQLDHHLFLVNTEFFGVTGSKLTESEAPSVQTGAESDGS